jgi:Putative zinc-finger
VYYSRVAHYGGAPDFARRAKQAEVLLRAREPHEALLERVEKRGGLRFFARFVPAFGRRTKIAGEAVEALGAACARARRRIPLSLDGQLAEPEQALLAGHLENCAACSSFHALSAAPTAMLRGTT